MLSTDLTALRDCLRGCSAGCAGRRSRGSGRWRLVLVSVVSGRAAEPSRVLRDGGEVGLVEQVVRHGREFRRPQQFAQRLAWRNGHRRPPASRRPHPSPVIRKKEVAYPPDRLFAEHKRQEHEQTTKSCRHSPGNRDKKFTTEFRDLLEHSAAAPFAESERLRRKVCFVDQERVLGADELLQ